MDNASSTPQESMAERIRSRSKSTIVPARDSSFAQPLAEPPQDLPSKEEIVPKQTFFSPTQELSGLPQTADRRQIRLEVGIDSELEALCRTQKITVETFLEAAYLEIEQDPEMKSRVMAIAKTRLSDRKKAGNLRRMQTQLGQANFGQ
jgi:hypothetical protein